MKKLFFPVIFLLIVFPARAEEFLIEENVRVVMRDGVGLAADIWRPAASAQFPVLLYRTPYDKRDAERSYTIFRRAVERGYAVVIQDVRGRYASEGDFEPYRNEGRDGYDTIEWAARQPWSNGSVGTFGLSYPGAVQWLAAVERPPHLKAMAPAMTFSTPRNFFYSGGVFDLSWIGWVWNYIAPDVRVRKKLAGPKSEAEARAEWLKRRDEFRRRLPLSALDELRDVAPYYFEWMRHPAADPWWDWAELRDKYTHVGAAVLNLSGWYDEAYGPEGAITNFSGLVKARAGRGDLRAKLIVGPWTHGVEEMGETRSGVREFGPAARLDYEDTVLRWMDHYVRGVENGVDREKPVRIFVMGDNAWRDADTWPLDDTEMTSLYLAPPQAGEKRARLLREVPRQKIAFSSFLSHPAEPVVDPLSASSGAHDYRALADRADVLVFDSEPLREDLNVTGSISAEIHLSCDCADTDVWVRLLDVAPDGTALNLMSPGLDVLRASYRSGGPGREPLKPGRVYALRLTNLVTSNVFKKGHRVRAQISASFFPHFSRNLHSGELETVSSRMRRATVRIHHDARHRSRLVLPVVSR